MSRIYEALQRADRERAAAQGSDSTHVAEPAIAFAIDEPPPTKIEVALDKVSQYPWKPNALSFPTLEDRGAGVEQFRGLRSRVYQARYEAALKTVLVCSGMPGEGKSFVAANLAMSLARNSVNNILLIDGDLRRPTLHNLLGAPNVPGLSEYLSGIAQLNEVLQRDSNSKAGDTASGGALSNLTFIPAGKCGDNSSELVANHRIEELVATLSVHFDWIIIDSPPVLAVTDAVELARSADAVLLVARGARTPFDVAQRTQAAFSSSRVLGFVLNAVKNPPRRGSYYYYYSNQDAGGESNKRREKRY